VVEKMEEKAMDLVVAQLLCGLVEVACQLADVVDVSLDGLGRAIAWLKVFDEALPERSHGQDSRGNRGRSRGQTAATILTQESPGRRSF
jgi:hypothetical protein